MKNTKENLIKLLNEMREINHRIANSTNNPELKFNLLTEACAFLFCIELLEDKEFFNRTWRNTFGEAK